MKNNLDNLWFNYFVEFPANLSNKEKTSINRYKEKEHTFRSLLNKEQIKAFEEYDRELSNINTIYEKNAFVKGFTFATQLFLQVMREE